MGMISACRIKAPPFDNMSANINKIERKQAFGLIFLVLNNQSVFLFYRKSSFYNIILIFVHYCEENRAT